MFELMGPLGLSVSRLYASSGGSRPWGSATAHQLVLAVRHSESFDFVMTSDDLFMTTLEGLIVTEEMDYVEDYPLIKCNTPSKGQVLLAVSA